MAFNEDSRVKIPTILHLCRVGYEYLSLTGAYWDVSTNIFKDIFLSNVQRLNHELTVSQVLAAFENVNLELDNEDLGKAFYEMLTSGSEPI